MWHVSLSVNIEQGLARSRAVSSSADVEQGLSRPRTTDAGLLEERLVNRYDSHETEEGLALKRGPHIEEGLAKAADLEKGLAEN